MFKKSETYDDIFKTSAEGSRQRGGAVARINLLSNSKSKLFVKLLKYNVNRTYLKF